MSKSGTGVSIFFMWFAQNKQNKKMDKIYYDEVLNLLILKCLNLMKSLLIGMVLWGKENSYGRDIEEKRHNEVQAVCERNWRLNNKVKSICLFCKIIHKQCDFVWIKEIALHGLSLSGIKRATHICTIL